MPPASVIRGTGARNNISAQSAINEGNFNPNKPGPITRTDTKITRYASPGTEVNVPIADQGQPIPYLIGRRMLSAPCAIWTGVPQTKQTVTSTTVEARYLTVPDTSGLTHGWHYNYRLMPVDLYNIKLNKRNGKNAFDPVEEEDDDLPEDEVTLSTSVDYALALCLGPGVFLMGMYDENGNIASSTITGGGLPVVIPPSIGEAATFYGGEWDQPRDPTIAATNPETSAYRGISYIVIKGAVLDDGTPLASVFYECLRLVNYLNLTDAAQIAGPGFDMNIANAICDLLTNDWGSIGLSGDYIDNVTFTAAAIQLAEEGNWCSLLISDKTSIKSVIAGLTAQANGCMRWNPKLGKLQFILFREAEDVLALPLFDKNNTASIAGLAKQTWYGLPQGINFSFVDRNERYNPATVLVGINREAEHASVIMSETFDAICEPAVASVVIRETYKRLITPLLTGEVMTNRDAEALFPGDAIRVTKENVRGMVNFPMRITSMKEEGDLFDTYSLTVTQDVFPYRKAEFDVPNSSAPNTNQEPVLPTSGQIDPYDAPLFFLSRARGQLYGATLNDDFHVQHIMVRTGAPFYAKAQLDSGPREVVPIGNPTPRGTLVSSIGEFDGYDRKYIDDIVVEGVDFVDYIMRAGIDFQRGAGGMLAIGDELFFCQSIQRSGDNRVSCYSVNRGVIDTVPMSHAAGANVDFIIDYTATSRVAITGDLDLQVSGVGGLLVGQEFTNVIFPPINPSRAKLPACPQNGQISAGGGFDYFRDVPDITRGTTYTVAWKRRNRLASTMSDFDTDQNPGEVTTYNVAIRTSAHYYVLATGVAGSSTPVDIPVPGISGVYAGPGIIEIRAVTANGQSLYLEKIRINLV